MLPSTGYFKGINCPFFDSGLCERPYCHFRHVKRDFQNTSNDRIESGAILQKLVSAAVQKVLQQSEATSITCTNLVPSGSEDENKINQVKPISKATYNPTPISELNKINNIDIDDLSVEDVAEQRKKHIPVPYTPRKPANLPNKRPVDSNGSSKPFSYIPPPVKYTPGCAENVLLDPYTPKGTVESNDKYLPGSEIELRAYKPKESKTSGKLNYIPSDKNTTKKKVLEYKPVKVTSQTELPSVTYQPTLRSLAPCFSSDEEPDVKKQKLSNDLNGLDDLGPEFDILDQILDEEKSHTLLNNSPTKEDTCKKGVENTAKEGSKKENENVIKDSCEKVRKVKDNIAKENSDKSKDINETNSKTSREKYKEGSNNAKENKERNKDLIRNEQPTHKSKKHEKKSHKASSKSREKDHSKTSSSDKKHRSSSKEKHGNSSKVSTHSSSHKTGHSSKHSDVSKSKEEKHSKHSSGSSKRKEKSSHHKSSKDQSKIREEHKKSKDEKSLQSNISLKQNDMSEEEVIDETEILYEMSESDEETIALECRRIFEEYVPTEKAMKNVENLDNINLDTEENEFVPGKKRISRTMGKQIKVVPKVPMKPNYKTNAALAMSERLTKIKEYHAAKNVVNTPTVSSTNIANTKIRIAHVPYASTLLNAKKTIGPSSNYKTEPSTSSTITQSAKKGTQRVAHVLNEKFIDRPGVLEPLGSKIPANIRSIYLNMMIDECLKIYLHPTDAYARAQHEELNTSKKCSTVQIYKNSAVLTVSRLRKEFQECNGIKKSECTFSNSHKAPQTISGKTSNTGSWSFENKSRTHVDQSQEFSGPKLYKNIAKWILTEEQLQQNGFPRPHISGEKGRATIYGQNKQKPPKGFIRTCCRCKKDYTVDKKHFPAIKQECIYHPNNKYRVRGEVKYQCCGQEGSSDGCCIAPCHVYEYVDYDNLKGYVKTLPSEREMGDYGVYSLDCEMCYTTHGLDLTRVTVINSASKVVYETLVKPLHPIMDYNTRYSGITEEQMVDVTTTLLDVQATLLTMFNSNTILIGHSLESDFKALKLIHDTVIDTSVLFPHKMGPPFKRALRNLCSEHLKKIIQNSVDGHDSAEDATVCMELIIYKLKEDLKTR